MRIDFEVVKRKGFKRYKCSCGKFCAKQRTFEQSINPFNKNAQGLQKKYNEIILELEKVIKDWSGVSDECTHGQTH